MSQITTSEAIAEENDSQPAGEAKMVLLARAAALRLVLQQLEDEVDAVRPAGSPQCQNRIVRRKQGDPRTPEEEMVDAWRHLSNMVNEAWQQADVVMKACFAAMRETPGSSLPHEFYDPGETELDDVNEGELRLVS